MPTGAPFVVVCALCWAVAARNVRAESQDTDVPDKEKDRSVVLARGAMALTMLFGVLTVIEMVWSA